MAGSLLCDIPVLVFFFLNIFFNVIVPSCERMDRSTKREPS